MKTFSYNGNNYKLSINVSDPSGIGCIREIVTRNEYTLDKFVDCDSTFIDIGANCGVATIILAKQNPKSTVYSFEPHKATYDLLVSNVKINELTNVKTFNMAVSDVSGKTVSLFLSPLCSGGNTICSDDEAFVDFYYKNANEPNVKENNIKTISLDDIISNNDITEVELLKIDCEGAEYEILYNSVKLRNDIIKNMVGEFHDLSYNTKAENNSKKLLQYCDLYVDGIKNITFLTL